MLSKNSKRRDSELKPKPLVFLVETGESRSPLSIAEIISSDSYAYIIQKAGEVVAGEGEERTKK